MARKHAFYAQSGGVTAVINASAAGVIEAARASRVIGKVYAGRNGILGALTEDLIDTSRETRSAIAALRHTPGGAFGSCRYRLRAPEDSPREYERLIQVFQAHDIGYFFYNGGGDSADTCLKVSRLAETLGYPIQAIHIPKTVDNDLPITDCSPGFGSIAKYTAVSLREAALDVAAMASTSTRVFIMEVMGRHAGWVAAAAGLARQQDGEAPHLILFPEIPFEGPRFLRRVRQAVKRHGHCVVAVSEGTRDRTGRFLAESGLSDAFGHAQLGGAAPHLAALVRQELGEKVHWAVPDYLQRSARHLASATDLAHADAVGRAAVALAEAGHNAVMPAIRRLPGRRYRWTIEPAPLEQVANVERTLPRHFITRDGFGITDAARDYLLPLIQGEAETPWRNGLPVHARLRLEPVPRRLKERFQP